MGKSIPVDVRLDPRRPTILEKATDKSFPDCGVKKGAESGVEET